MTLNGSCKCRLIYADISISLLTLLAVSLLLSESTLTDALVHGLVLIQDNRVHGTSEGA